MESASLTSASNPSRHPRRPDPRSRRLSDRLDWQQILPTSPRRAPRLSRRSSSRDFDSLPEAGRHWWPQRCPSLGHSRDPLQRRLCLGSKCSPSRLSPRLDHPALSIRPFSLLTGCPRPPRPTLAIQHPIPCHPYPLRARLLRSPLPTPDRHEDRTCEGPPRRVRPAQTSSALR